MDLDIEYQLPSEEPCHQQPQVEEVEDEGEPSIGPHCEQYIQGYPHSAGQWIRQARTAFKSLLEAQVKAVAEQWEPFESQEEWELVTWLMKNVGQNATDEYLKLPIFLQKVDALPTGPKWNCEIVHVEGNMIGEDGQVMFENLELWMRDPVECICKLIENPAFKNLMAYLPEQAFLDEACLEQIYDEMWMSDWWWKIQASYWLFHYCMAKILESLVEASKASVEMIHKGVFKDHFVKWCTMIVGADEIDACFKAMANHSRLHHFKKGILLVSQWTSMEYKEMKKVFMGVLAEAVNSQVLTTAHAFLDFIFYAQYQLHTSKTLASLQSFLNMFHAHKDIFIKLECQEDFNIPKFHLMIHYVEAICALGSPDSYNTEASEQLHIDFAKEAYHASNKQDYVEQMALWLQRQEAMWTREAFCKWVVDARYAEVVPGPDMRKACPPFKNITIAELASTFGAVNFIPTLTSFLCAYLPGVNIFPNQYKLRSCAFGMDLQLIGGFTPKPPANTMFHLAPTSLRSVGASDI
ncbi:hypothetical protein C0995_000743 [Termitomyces sp. Mi166|nr:hypothetical protein C0995_000743 [Termitomyces sp. Mi166\